MIAVVALTSIANKMNEPPADQLMARSMVFCSLLIYSSHSVHTENIELKFYVSIKVMPFYKKKSRCAEVDST